MQPSKFLTHKNFFLGGIVLLSFCLMVSCKQQIKIASVKYSSTVVEKWLADSTVSEFVFQFYTPKSNTGNPFQLISYVCDSNGKCFNETNPDLLDVKSETKFNEKAIFGNNVVLRELLDSITKDSSGHKISYDYLLLIPEIEAKYQHVVYAIKVVKGEEFLKTTPAKPRTNPCPPDCPRPPGQ